ncbi:MAG: anti-sigma factor domain-containing protein [Actinomycetota bacterium]
MDRELTHDELRELLGAYALDAVEVDEREVLERHLADCLRCRAELAEHRSVAALIAGGGAPAPVGVWDLIEAAIEEGQGVGFPVARLRGPRVWQRVALGLTAAAVAAIALLGTRVIQQGAELEDIRALLSGGGLVRAANAALLDPAAERLTLASDDGRLSVEAVLLPDGTGYLVQGNLPLLKEARTYQLWAFVEGRAVSAGVLGRDATVSAFEAPAGLSALAITAEPVGGSVRPSNSPVVLAEVRASQ